MSAFLFALVAVFVTSTGSRDQLLVARFAARLGRSLGLLLTGCTIAAATAAVMAMAGQYIAVLLPADGKNMLVAIALLLAAGELAWPNSERAPREPTRSLFPIAMVLVSRQIGDGARFLVFAIAAGWAAPWLAAAGGALGGMAAITAGWMLADRLETELPLRAIRLGLAAVIAIAAVIIGLSARGLIG